MPVAAPVTEITGPGSPNPKHMVALSTVNVPPSASLTLTSISSKVGISHSAVPAQEAMVLRLYILVSGIGPEKVKLGLLTPVGFQLTLLSLLYSQL